MPVVYASSPPSSATPAPQYDDDRPPPGDVARGLKLFKRHCVQCHSTRPNSNASSNVATIGPSLFNIIGKCSGRYEGVLSIGQGNMSTDIIWTDGELMRYMLNPRQFVNSQSLTMNFKGIPNIQERGDILAYLHTLNYETLRQEQEEKNRK